MAELKTGVPLSMGDQEPPEHLVPKDLASDRLVRWCPGCGDYAILRAVGKTLVGLGVRRSDTVFVSGIGCSSRFPYYMDTYGFHTIHGRAVAVATGLKVSRPDLDVWVVTGDGDALSIGGNHLLHALRRNVGIKILVLNNRIYGLTKGQASPTSEVGKVTKSTPWGAVDRPVNPLLVALGAEATFVARTADVFGKHMVEVLRRAHEHEGSAFVEIWQNCVIFNDGAFSDVVSKEAAADHVLWLEQGKPLTFGEDGNKGIRMSGMCPEVAALDDGAGGDDLLVHDEATCDPAYACMLACAHHRPGFPEPMGVLRSIERPVYEMELARQLIDADSKKGPGELDVLLRSGDVWEVP